MLICEDSIVRGTQLKNFTVKKLLGCGATEVHVRPACPPLMFPCTFNVSTRSVDELIARRAINAIEGTARWRTSRAYLDPDSGQLPAMVDWIAKDIGVTTLALPAARRYGQAIGLPRETPLHLLLDRQDAPRYAE